MNLPFFNTFYLNSMSSIAVKELMSKFLNSLFKPEIANSLLPNYPLGCKRILLSPNLEFYTTLAQNNVTLVTDSIKSFNTSGISTSNDNIQVDAIIYATGFHVGKINLTIEGKEGVCLPDKPKETYWGVTCSGFPNVFTLLGSNTGLGHNSVVWMAECQVNYIMKCIQFMISNSIKEFDLKSERAEDWYNNIVLPGFSNKVWISCNSWYKDENGRIFALWPYHTFSYWWGILKAQYTLVNDYTLRK